MQAIIYILTQMSLLSKTLYFMLIFAYITVQAYSIPTPISVPTRQSFRQSLLNSLMGNTPKVINVDPVSQSSTSTTATVISISTPDQPSPSLMLNNNSKLFNLEPIQQQSPPVQKPQAPPQSNIQSSIQQSIINTVKQQSNKKFVSQSSFYKLPKPQQLQSIILTADSFPIVKTIQQVVQANISCQQKVGYLSEFFGRIQSAISVRNYTNTHIKQVISAAQQQLKILNKQIEQNQASINKISLPIIKDRLSQSVIQLTAAYGIYNKVYIEQKPKQLQIESISANISQTKQRSDQARSQIPTQKQKLQQLNYNISILEQQLNSARTQKVIAQSIVIKLEQDVKIFDDQVLNFQYQRAIAQNQLDKIQKEVDQRKSNYKLLQVDVERLRSQVADAEKKQNSYNTRINQLQQRITNEQKKLTSSDLLINQQLVKDLTAMLPNLQQKIDENNYYCNQVKQMQNTKSKQQIIYIFTPKQFTNYLQASYQIKTNIYNLSPVKVQLSPITIQSNDWKSTFGIPYSTQSLNKADHFYYKEDFSCFGSSNLQTGYGKIINISKKIITLQSNTLKFKLNLSACSRLESTSSLPYIGQEVYFRGNKLQEGQYNVFKATCF